MPALDERALKYACQRVEDFAKVNVARSDEDKAEALDLWLASLGLDLPLRVQFKDWLMGFAPDHEGPVYLGLTIGLFVLQFVLDGS